MRVAVIGGNLTGCATARYLRKANDDLKADYEAKVNASQRDTGILPPPPNKIEVTVFESRNALGGYKFQTEHIEEIPVEVGRFATIHADAVYTNDLIKEYKKEIELDKYWLSGTNGRSVRSFAILDWVHNRYLVHHGSFRIFDSFSAGVQTEMTIPLERLKTFAQAFVIFFTLVCFPKYTFGQFSRTVAFWTSTLLSFLNYGLTAGLSRGASKGYVEHFKFMQEVKAATKSITIGHLLNRCGLGSFSSLDAAQTFQKFKFSRDFVSQIIDPQIQSDYADGKFTSKDLSTLAALLCMQRADVTEGEKILRIKGGNARLCDAIIGDARQMLNTTVVKIKTNTHEDVEDGRTLKYTISYRIQAQTALIEEDFDGIVLCACPNLEELTLDGMDGNEVLGYTKDYVTRSISNNRARWLAIVAGRLNPGFFDHYRERNIPDKIVGLNTIGWSMVECVAESAKGKIYHVLCTEKPMQGSGLIADMFEEVREMKTKERKQPKYRCSPLVNGVNSSDVPSIILDYRFVYAASIDRIACDPETDIVAAMNAASLFSVEVVWNDNVEETIDDNEQGAITPDNNALTQ